MTLDDDSDRSSDMFSLASSAVLKLIGSGTAGGLVDGRRVSDLSSGVTLLGKAEGPDDWLQIEDSLPKEPQLVGYSSDFGR